jgi:hypothetical protein
MASNAATVTIHLQVMLNGKPIDKVIKASALIEQPETLRGHADGGLHLLLLLDGEQFAEALTPMILDKITKTLRTATDRRY